jgi:hypothetical protein
MFKFKINKTLERDRQTGRQTDRQTDRKEDGILNRWLSDEQEAKVSYI